MKNFKRKKPASQKGATLFETALLIVTVVVFSAGSLQYMGKQVNNKLDLSAAEAGTELSAPASGPSAFAMAAPSTAIPGGGTLGTGVVAGNGHKESEVREPIAAPIDW